MNISKKVTVHVWPNWTPIKFRDRNFFMQIWNVSGLNMKTYFDMVDLESMLIQGFQENAVLEQFNFNQTKVSLSREHATRDVIPITLHVIERLMDMNPVAVAFVNDNGKVEINDYVY